MSLVDPLLNEDKAFMFSEENQKRAQDILSKYPENRRAAATLPLLDLAQRQEGWLSKSVIESVAEIVGSAPIRVYEVASFYTMFYLKPMGKHVVQVCSTTPCWLKGSDEITEACQKKLGIGFGETTKDGKFSLLEVECLGACVNAPMVQINDDYYEDLTPDMMEVLLEDLAQGRKPKVGSQIGRKGSEPLDDKKLNDMQREIASSKNISLEGVAPKSAKEGGDRHAS